MATTRCCAPVASAAKLFVQLSTRPSLSTTASVLDVLVPAQTRALHLAFAPQHPRTSQTTKAPSLRCSNRNTSQSSSVIWSRSCTPARFFSSTGNRPATKAIFNPQEDDDGKDMFLEITPRAAKRLEQIMTKDGNPNLALRIQVESGGCHGFQYIMSLTNLPSELSSSPGSMVSKTQANAASPSLSFSETAETITPSTTTSNTPSAPSLGEEDTVFAFVPEDAGSNTGEQSTSESPTAKIILDKPSLDLLRGSKVDYTMELIGSQFKIVDNPFATSSCGCGTSFDIKM